MKPAVLPWFPCEQSKLLGALQAMKPHVGYTYVIVILRCYEGGGSCTDTLDALARRTGHSKRVVTDALDVLFRAGKLAREASGIVNPYAAEVINGMKAHRERLVAAGRSGGVRAGQKRQQNHERPPSQAKAAPQRASSKSTSTEIKEESLFPSVTESATKKEPPRAPWPQDYREQFWSNYPRQTEKKAALAKLDAIKKSGAVTWAEMIGGVLRLVQAAKAARTEERYIKHPTTWLNRGCWEDKYGGLDGGSRPASGNRGFAAVTRNLLEREMEERYGETAGAGADERDIPAEDPGRGGRDR